MEEHLLTCPNCLDRLQAEIEFAAAMREAAVMIRDTERHSLLKTPAPRERS